VDLLDFWRLHETIEAAPRAHNYYIREAYVTAGKATVRVTMDRDVYVGPEFTGDLGIGIDQTYVQVYSGFVILELKFTERMPNWLIEMVHSLEVKTSGAAKYGMGVELLGPQKVARRRTGFAWGQSVTSAATSAPWLDNSALIRGALGPNREFELADRGQQEERK